MSQVEERDQKRRRVDENESNPLPVSRRASVADLPDTVLRECLFFVGPGHFRNVAGTCRRFHEQYLFPKKTTWESAAASAKCAKLCLEDHVEDGGNIESTTRALPKIVHAATSLGNVEVLQWAFGEHGHIPDWRAFVEAVERGHVTVLEWAEVNRIPLRSRDIWEIALRHGHVHMLEWIHQHIPFELDDRNRRLAGECGQIPVLRWMVDRNLLPTDDRSVWLGAINERNIHVLDWLHEHGFPLYKPIVEFAAASGSINVLAWAHSHGLPFSSSACREAAYSGHLDALKWLREHDCPWNEKVIKHAEHSRYYVIAQWARDNGCPEPERG